MSAMPDYKNRDLAQEGTRRESLARAAELFKAQGWRIVKLDGPRNPAIRNEPLYAVEDEL